MPFYCPPADLTPHPDPIDLPLAVALLAAGTQPLPLPVVILTAGEP